ncbi:uncharacterized protein ACNLHF_007860 isoform 1-T3 [Anomaloglossus baeobatrachus]
MAWYKRLKLDVPKIIRLVESMPCIWDPTCPEYLQKIRRSDSWISICRELYPQWDEADKALQKRIEQDVRKRWRSVKDRYNKIRREGTKSGRSPVQPNFIYYEDLKFLSTGRILRPTQGNITAETDENQDLPGKTTEQTELEKEADCSLTSQTVCG